MLPEIPWLRFKIIYCMLWILVVLLYIQSDILSYKHEWFNLQETKLLDIFLLSFFGMCQVRKFYFKCVWTVEFHEKKNDQCTLARGLMPTISQIKTLLPCCATYLGDKGVSVLMTKLKYWSTPKYVTDAPDQQNQMSAKIWFSVKISHPTHEYADSV